MKSAHTGPIGLFDSGLGGLTVLKELHRVLPSREYVYLGDNARFPYGTKSVDTIVRYSRECADFLVRHGVSIVVVACNTASSAALEHLEQELSIPVIGTVEPAVRAAMSATRNGKVGLLGTNATCASGVYDRALGRADRGISVTSQACPLFVPLVEAGMLSGDIVDKVVELYLAPLVAADVDTVILGCTHYPMLLQPIQKYLGEGVCVVECSTAIAEDVKIMTAVQHRESLVAAEVGASHYYVTDEVGRFNFLASAFLGGCEVSAAKIDGLSVPSDQAA